MIPSHVRNKFGHNSIHLFDIVLLNWHMHLSDVPGTIPRKFDRVCFPALMNLHASKELPLVVDYLR